MPYPLKLSTPREAEVATEYGDGTRFCAGDVAMHDPDRGTFSGPVHTAECLERQKNATAARQAWFAQWPKACAKCVGEGGKLYPGSYWDPPDFEPCSQCVAAGKCARCGYQHAEGTAFSDNGDVPCDACGWNPQLPDMAPELWICYGDCGDDTP